MTAAFGIITHYYTWTKGQSVAKTYTFTDAVGRFKKCPFGSAML